MTITTGRGRSLRTSSCERGDEAAGEAVEPERRARPLRPNSNRPQHRLITESPHQATYDPRVEVTRPAKRRRRGRRQVRGLERRGHLTGMMMIVDRPAEVEDHSELGSGNLNVVKLRQSAAVGFSGSSDGQSAVEQRPGQIVGSAESSGSTTRPPGTSSPPNRGWGCGIGPVAVPTDPDWQSLLIRGSFSPVGDLRPWNA